jgi:stage II sporulation protein D
MTVAPGEPTIRVGLVVDRDSAILSASGQWRGVDPSGGAIAIMDAGETVIVRAGDGGRDLSLTRSGAAAPIVAQGNVVIVPERPGDFVGVGSRRYRGDLLVLRGTAGITVVNRVPLESYLLSVVALELGFRNPSDKEAVKAQAVAARSYALRGRGRREALGFDVYPTDADQVYGGVDAEFQEIDESVVAVSGEVLTWQGQPIQALFHSTCGFSTEASDQVFQNQQPVPYLRAVSDRYGDGDHDFYCSISPKFRWREEWDADGLTAILARTLPAIANGRTVGRVIDIRAGRTTPTGRVAELVVTTTSGDFTVGNGRVREVLRPAPDRQLQSTLFQLHVDKENGRLTKLVVSGAGYGHGVGMCQFGAVGRARAGESYRTILATYYNGTTLERYY